MYIDGVLRTKKRVPIRESVALYRTLKTTQKIFIICTDKTEAERWLKENNLGKFDDLIGTDVPDFHNNPLVSQAEYVRSQGPVDLVIVRPILFRPCIAPRQQRGPQELDRYPS